MMYLSNNDENDSKKEYLAPKKRLVVVLIMTAAIILSVSIVRSVIIAQGYPVKTSAAIIHFAYAQGSNSPAIFPIDSKPYGKTYGEWSVTWWQWSLSIPTDKNPLNDNTGKYCTEGQSGPMWFLAGTGGGPAERTCTIPSGKAIMLPTFNGECSYAEYPQYKTESELRECAKSQLDKVTNVDATIDGKKITDPQKYRAQSPIFDVTLPNNNLFGAPGGPTKSVADGFWLILSPLSPGRHEIRFDGSALDVTSSGVTNFATSVIYHLTVQ